MARIYDIRLQIHYGQAYVLADDSNGLGLSESFCGQFNGLCGAATSGSLFLNTGLHTGEVGFILDVLDAAPIADERWEEVVEVSLEVGDAGVALVTWDDDERCTIPLTSGSYRVRYCARNMQQGHESLGDEGLVDYYYLAFWPSPKMKDMIVKQTSGIAKSWHDYAQKL